VVLPNNEVLEDGILVRWTPEEFAKQKIPIERIGKSHEANHCKHVVKSNTHIMIFATVYLGQTFKQKCDTTKSIKSLRIIGESLYGELTRY
jgi:hypothetical protein